MVRRWVVRKFSESCFSRFSFFQFGVFPFLYSSSSVDALIGENIGALERKTGNWVDSKFSKGMMHTVNLDDLQSKDIAGERWSGLNRPAA